MSSNTTCSNGLFNIISSDDELLKFLEEFQKDLEDFEEFENKPNINNDNNNNNNNNNNNADDNLNDLKVVNYDHPNKNLKEDCEIAGELPLKSKKRKTKLSQQPSTSDNNNNNNNNNNNVNEQSVDIIQSPHHQFKNVNLDFRNHANVLNLKNLIKNFFYEEMLIGENVEVLHLSPQDLQISVDIDWFFEDRFLKQLKGIVYKCKQVKTFQNILCYKKQIFAFVSFDTNTMQVYKCINVIPFQEKKVNK